MYPQISVLVTSRNAPEHLNRCLSAIRQHTSLRYELIVADDSNDPEAVLASIHGPHRFMWLPGGEQRGFAKNANRALLLARGAFLTLPPLTDDLEVTPGWDEEAVRFLTDNPDVGQMSYHVMGPDGQTHNIGALFPRGAVHNPGKHIDYVGKGFTSREMLEHVGLFDESFSPMYGEDVDWSFRVRRLGFRLAGNGECVVLHHHDLRNQCDVDPFHIRKIQEKWGV